MYCAIATLVGVQRRGVLVFGLMLPISSERATGNWAQRQDEDDADVICWKVGKRGKSVGNMQQLQLAQQKKLSRAEHAAMSALLDSVRVTAPSRQAIDAPTITDEVTKAMEEAAFTSTCNWFVRRAVM